MTTIRDLSTRIPQLRSVDQVKPVDDFNDDITGDLGDVLSVAMEESLQAIATVSEHYAGQAAPPLEQPVADPVPVAPEPASAETTPVDPLAGLDPIQRRIVTLNTDVRNCEALIAELRQVHATRGAELHAELDEHRRFAQDKERALLREMEANQAELDGKMEMRQLLLASTQAALQVLDPPPANVKAVGKVEVAPTAKKKRKAKPAVA